MAGKRKASIGITRTGLAGLAVLATALLALTAGGTRAQEGPGGAINPGRDCQTIRTCRFTQGGSYRGCLSSYSCRVCRFVPARCNIGANRKRCYTSVCTWG